VAKQRYLHKKAQKRKILVKARKDAAPKNKAREEGVDQEQIVTDITNDTPQAIKKDITPQESAVTEQPEKRKKKKKVKADNEDSTRGTNIPKDSAIDTPGIAESSPADVEEDAEVDETAEIAQRKAAKRAKRAERDHEAKRAEKQKKIEKAKRAVEKAEKAQKAALLAVEVAAGGQDDVNEDIVMAEEDSDEPEDEGDVGSDEDTPDRPASPSKPLLEAFPLPQAPPAPSASLLARQGLPEGLKDASLVDQSLTIPIQDLMVTRRGKLEKGIDDSMAKKLEDMGITTFFAGQCITPMHIRLAK
jgi:ATP-dependent RNA helicase DDX51/DBP6